MTVAFRNFRLLTVGGILGYRALFNWLNPWIYIPSLIVGPIFEIIFFAYLGRTAGVENDTYYVVGNALVSAAIPCLFAMTNTIANERYTQTLPMLLASPASRVAVFLGRAIPVAANGMFVAAVAFVAGALVLDVHVPRSAWLPLVLAIAATAYATTGIGLVSAGLGLRWRETAVLANLIYAVLLIFTGVNVPFDRMPGWMETVARGLPVTHGVEAARELVAGSTLADVASLLGTEMLVGTCWLAAGLVLLRVLETSARRTASLDQA